jgi:hypothetical protein
MNLCVCENTESEHGDESEDVDMGWVCSREVSGVLGCHSGVTQGCHSNES